MHLKYLVKKNCNIGSIAIEDRTLVSEKIELADLQILLPEKMVYRGGKEILLNRHEFDTLV